MANLSAPYQFLHDSVALEAHKILYAHVVSESRKLGIDRTSRSLAVFKWDDGEGMIAGACGMVYPGWLVLDLLWVEEPYRRQGFGSALLKQIEDEAARMGAHSSYVWTQEFEAPGFYHGHDYREFVQLDEFPPGHQMIGLRKKFKRIS